MIDLGQAIPRRSSAPMQYSWNQVKPTALDRGTICVIRCSSGQPQVLALEQQANWREWTGAFSWI
jgi:hypothetical protein